MNNYFKLSREQQLMVLNQVSPKIGLPAQAIEKDIYVTTILQLVFTLPFANCLIFKGGTSLSKVWGVINRFSEDIDLAIDRTLFGLEGDLTKKKLKCLRKESSIFVREIFSSSLREKLEEYGLSEICSVESEPDGEGNETYPEPRKIFIHYKSAIGQVLGYMQPSVMLEIGSRSLFEPNEECYINSLVEGEFPTIKTSLVNSEIATSLPSKTFLEKVFLLHETFSVEGRGEKAERKSRHLYDLYQMMNTDIMTKALNDGCLWENIRHHREVFTSISGMDYSQDISQRIQLVPPINIIDVWREDYETMKEMMIYGSKPSFSTIIESMKELQEKFRNL
ncbi:MAG: nucleotidyl transferase AbiEii/AbiGii toxin family protein [Bacteroidales bacterium]|nr:nucleotidyl transferase AbiEii/AbiGii toxin family protein [Bacteroidales bacterium]